MSIDNPQVIYLNKVTEAVSRLAACEAFLASYHRAQDLFSFEAAILQMRKALEAVAYAAIAPNKEKYAEFREKAEEPADYRKDFNARKILQLLSEINPDFYPKPVAAPIQISPGHWHFNKREDASLTKKRFEAFYDRLGKFLHADNPWGKEKGMVNLAADLPAVINSTRLLLSWHYTAIRSPEFSGAWIVEVPEGNAPARIVTGKVDGEFVIR